jgi:hypothetical protein
MLLINDFTNLKDVLKSIRKVNNKEFAAIYKRNKIIQHL